MAAWSSSSRSVLSRLAWAAIALYVVLMVSGLRMHAEMMGIGTSDLWVGVAFLWGAVIGGLVIGRYPRHPVGWLFIAVAVSFGLAVFASGYALEAIVFNPGTLPAGEFFAWLSFWIEMPGVAAIALFLPLLFPDGRLPSQRWRPVGLLAGGLLVIAVLVAMFRPDAYPEYPNIRNPIGVESWKGILDLLDAGTTIALFVIVGLTVAAVIDRRRRANAVERLQLRWFTFACGTLAIAFLAVLFRDLGPVYRFIAEATALIAVTALPTAAGIAILRYRLYEIDIIINRTVVYVSLTAVLAGLYTAAVALFQRAIVAATGQSSDVAIVLTLFVLATVFTPIKNTLQSTADRYVKPVGAPSGHEAGNTAIDDLVRLAELHSRGILTDAEFAAKKKQVLGI